MTIVISRRAGGGVSKLSQLEIDVDKDWNSKWIRNAGVLSLGKITAVGLEEDEIRGLKFESDVGGENLYMTAIADEVMLQCIYGQNYVYVGDGYLLFSCSEMFGGGDAEIVKLETGKYLISPPHETGNYIDFMIGKRKILPRQPGSLPPMIEYGKQTLVYGNFNTGEVNVNEHLLMDIYSKYLAGVNHYSGEYIDFGQYGYSRQFSCDTNIDYEYYDVVDGFERAEFGLYGKQLGYNAVLGAYIGVSDFDLWFGIGDTTNRPEDEPVVNGFGFLSRNIVTGLGETVRLSSVYQIAKDVSGQYNAEIYNIKRAVAPGGGKKLEGNYGEIYEYITPTWIDTVVRLRSLLLPLCGIEQYIDDTPWVELSGGVQGPSSPIEFSLGSYADGNDYIAYLELRGNADSYFRIEGLFQPNLPIKPAIKSSSSLGIESAGNLDLHGGGELHLRGGQYPEGRRISWTTDVFPPYGYAEINVVNGIIDAHACDGIKVKYYEQDGEPTTIPANCFAFWKNTVDGTVWLIYHDGTSQKKVQLT